MVCCVYCARVCDVTADKFRGLTQIFDSPLPVGDFLLLRHSDRWKEKRGGRDGIRGDHSKQSAGLQPTVCEMVEKMMGRVRAGHMNHGDERSCPSSTRLPRSTTLPSAVPHHTTPPIHPFDEKDEKWD